MDANMLGIIAAILMCAIVLTICFTVKSRIKRKYLRQPIKNSSMFFCNKDCEYFPCHKVANPDEFNCLFCYCPLYHDPDCGGAYRPITLNGKPAKDCSLCTLPHEPNGWSWMMKKLIKM